MYELNKFYHNSCDNNNKINICKMKREQMGDTQDFLKNQSDYVGNNWYVVREETPDGLTGKVFYGRDEAEEYFNRRSHETRFEDEQQYVYDSNTTANRFSVTRYDKDEESHIAVYKLTIESFMGFLRMAIREWMENVIIAAVDQNTGNPYPYLVHLILFDRHGLNEQFVNELNDIDRPFVDWVRGLYAEDPLKLNVIVCDVAMEFYDSCGYNNSTRHVIDYAQNEYISHVEGPVGSIHILYRDSFGPDKEEYAILKLGKRNDENNNTRQEQIDDEELPF